MQKAESQNAHAQNQPAVRQVKGMAFDSPQREQIAQFEAMAESSPQAGKQAQFATVIASSPALAAQRKLIGRVDNSPAQVAQRQAINGIVQRAETPAKPSAPIQLSGREGDELDPGPGQGEQAPPTPRPVQGGRDRPPPPEGESLIQDGYSPRAGEERDEAAQLVKVEESSQRKVTQCAEVSVKANNTGLPDSLKRGIESLSGMAMDNVKVHYNSSQPAQLNALAYAQGTDIHVGPGQERHLPHEAWHVVQQAQGRVKPTMQMKEGVPVNDDAGLEHEADVMGGKASSLGVVQGGAMKSDSIGFVQRVSEAQSEAKTPSKVGGVFGERVPLNFLSSPVQRYKYQSGKTTSITLAGGTSNKNKTFEICMSNRVEYKKGDVRQTGTDTGTASWKGWLIDSGTANNATQLHVVNQEWGGLGGAGDGNVGPGSQKLNGQHKGPEYKYKNLFRQGKADYDMTYECKFGYGDLLNYNNQTITNPVQIADPTIYVEIDAANGPNGEHFGEGWVVPTENAPGMTIEDGG